jgi:hypothetical protein
MRLPPGSGKRLFGKGIMPTAFKLIHTRTSTIGVIMSTYRRAGSILHGRGYANDTGSFALAEPTEPEIARRQKTKREG